LAKFIQNRKNPIGEKSPLRGDLFVFSIEKKAKKIVSGNPKIKKTREI
jgi:hypothetical protein